MQIQLLISNTMNLLLEGLAYENGSYINDADSATVQIMDRNEVDVVGETWPLALAYVASSSGDYTAKLSSNLELVKGQKYIVEVVAIKDSNKGTWRETAVAVERGF